MTNENKGYRQIALRLDDLILIHTVLTDAWANSKTKSDDEYRALGLVREIIAEARLVD